MTPVSVCSTVAAPPPVTATSSTEPTTEVEYVGISTVYDPVKPRAAREFAVCGSMTWRLTASAVRVSDELKFRYGFPPVPPDWDREASRTTDAFA